MLYLENIASITMSLLLRVVKYLGLAKHTWNMQRADMQYFRSSNKDNFFEGCKHLNIFYRPSTTIDILSWECSMYELNRNVNN